MGWQKGSCAHHRQITGALEERDQRKRQRTWIAGTLVSGPGYGMRWGWTEYGPACRWCLDGVGGGGDGKELTKDSLRRGDVWSKGSKGKVQADLKSGFHDGTHFRSREGNRMEREPGGTESAHSRQVGEVLGIPQILKGTLIDNS